MWGETLFCCSIKWGVQLSGGPRYPSVELLGFRVNALGQSTTAEKIEAWTKLQFPARLNDLETFIGSTGYVRHLIPYYAQFIEPLQRRKTKLLAEGRKEGKVVIGNRSKRQAFTRSKTYEPTEAELFAFQAIKDQIATGRMLHHHDPARRLFIQLDGSLQYGFGVMAFHLRDGYDWDPAKPAAIASTAVQPVTFLSRELTAAERKYGPSELEMACLVFAAQKLRPMIQSTQQPVIILTDHAATRDILAKTTLETSSADRSNRRLVNAACNLSQYQFQVLHIPGRTNTVPDALSRLATLPGGRQLDPEYTTLDDVWLAMRHSFIASEAVMDPSTREEFINSYKEDEKYRAVREDLLKQAPENNEGVAVYSLPGLNFELHNGLLYHINVDRIRRLCIPEKLIPTILGQAHDAKHHFGENRMCRDLCNVRIHL